MATKARVVGGVCGHGVDMLERAFLSVTLDPTPLLKFGRGGKPGFRTFALTADLMHLRWTSKNKNKSPKVSIKDMQEIRYGQRTDKFKKANRPDLQHLSFSIIYLDPLNNGSSDSVDLVCKDEHEFELWTRALSTLIEGKTDLTAYLLTIQKSMLQRQQQDGTGGATATGGGGGGGADGMYLTNGAAAGTTAGVGGKRKKTGRGGSAQIFKTHVEAKDVYSCGWGEWGQNGVGSTDLEVCSTPKLLEALLGKPVVQIAHGWSHTAVLLESGELLQYGNRIGTGLNEDYIIPTITPIHWPMAEKTSIVHLACGAFHTAALTERGQVLTWGCNVHGQLGHGDRRDQSTPKLIEAFRQKPAPLSSTSSSSSSSTNAAATPASPSSPTSSPSLTSSNSAPSTTSSSATSSSELFIVSIACGSSFTAAITDEGLLYTWGCGEHGVLGHNDTHDRLVPTQVQDLAGADITKVACGDCHMFAATSRELYAVGWNSCAQLGLGMEIDQLRPHVVEVLRGNEVKEIAAGATHSVALVYMSKLNSDVLYAFGSNQVGQCGAGKKARLSRPTPVQLPLTLPDRETRELKRVEIVEVRCGAFHTLIRTSNGEVLATGSNKHGQLGIPLRNARSPRNSSSKSSTTSSSASTSSSSTAAMIDEFRVIDFLKDKCARSLACGGENSSILTTRAWVEDSEATDCMSCKSPFTFVNRKHHCRNCGGIFCGSCSSKKIAILRMKLKEPVRVCNSCYTMLGGR